jgi:hypothetical protein
MADNTADNNLNRFNKKMKEALGPLTSLVTTIKSFERSFKKFSVTFNESTKLLNMANFGKKLTKVTDLLGESGKQLKSIFDKLNKINNSINTNNYNNQQNQNPNQNPSSVKGMLDLIYLVKEINKIKVPGSTPGPLINFVDALKGIDPAKVKDTTKVFEEMVSNLTGANPDIKTSEEVFKLLQNTIKNLGSNDTPELQAALGNLTLYFDAVKDAANQAAAAAAAAAAAPTTTDILEDYLKKVTPPQNKFDKLLNKFDDFSDSLSQSIAEMMAMTVNNKKGGPQSAEDYEEAIQKSLIQLQSMADRSKDILDDQIDRFNEMNMQALATGATQADMMAKVSTEFGMSLGDMAEEFILLREVGINKLNSGTQKLISQMKLTGQDTAGLRILMSENTSKLLLNRNQSELLVNALDETAKKYGDSTEHVVDSLNQMAESLGAIQYLAPGNTAMAEGIAQLTAQLKNGNDRIVQQALSFAMNPDNLQTAIALGMTDAIQKFQTASTGAEAAAAAMEIIRKGAGSFREKTSAIAAGPMGQKQLQMMGEALGGTEQLIQLEQAAKSLQNIDINTFQTRNAAYTTQGILNSFYQPFEIIGSTISEIYNWSLQVLGPILQPIAKIAGWIAATFSTILAIKGILIGMKTARSALSFLPMIGRFLMPLIAPLLGFLAPLLPFIATIAAIAGLTYLVIKSIDKKTPDPLVITDSRARFENSFARVMNSITKSISGDSPLSNNAVELMGEIVRENKQTNSHLKDVNNNTRRPPVTRTAGR